MDLDEVANYTCMWVFTDEAVFNFDAFYASLNRALIKIILSMDYLLLRRKGWLVGCFGLKGPLRQYFSLYRAVSQREGERKEK